MEERWERDVRERRERGKREESLPICDDVVGKVVCVHSYILLGYLVVHDNCSSTF